MQTWQVTKTITFELQDFCVSKGCQEKCINVSFFNVFRKIHSISHFERQTMKMEDCLTHGKIQEKLLQVLHCK